MPLTHPENFPNLRNPHDRPWGGREYWTVIWCYPRVDGYEKACLAMKADLAKAEAKDFLSLYKTLSASEHKHYNALSDDYLHYGVEGDGLGFVKMLPNGKYSQGIEDLEEHLIPTFDPDLLDERKNLEIRKEWTATDTGKTLPLGELIVDLEHRYEAYDRVEEATYYRLPWKGPEWMTAFEAMSNEYAIAMDEARDDETRVRAAFGTYYIFSHLMPFLSGSSTGAHVLLGHMLDAMGLDLPPQAIGKDMNVAALNLPFDTFYDLCLHGPLLDHTLRVAELEKHYRGYIEPYTGR